MRLKEFKRILSAIQEEVRNKGASSPSICLEDEDFHDARFINTIGFDDEKCVVLAERFVDRKDYDLTGIEQKISKWDDDALVYFSPIGYNKRTREQRYNISSDWNYSEKDNTVVLYYFEGNGYIDNAMTISQLTTLLSQYNSREIPICVSDEKKLEATLVTGEFFRSHEVVLHSKDYEDREISLPSVAHLQHYLKWYDDNCTVCFMKCYKTPRMYDFYDIVGSHLGEDGCLVLEAKKRHYIRLSYSS